MICSCGEHMIRLLEDAYKRDGKWWMLWECAPCKNIAKVEDAED